MVCLSLDSSQGLGTRLGLPSVIANQSDYGRICTSCSFKDNSIWWSTVMDFDNSPIQENQDQIKLWIQFLIPNHILHASNCNYGNSIDSLHNIMISLSTLTHNYPMHAQGVKQSVLSVVCLSSSSSQKSSDLEFYTPVHAVTTTNWANTVNEDTPLLRNTFPGPLMTSNWVNLPLKMQLKWRL